MDKSLRKDSAGSLRNLYPELNHEELAIAENKLDEYLRFAITMYERISRDPELYSQFITLTKQQKDHTIDRERSNPNESSTSSPPT